ncbi:MAG: hypothetical protein H6895_00485 [Defluviimonas sp.]|uniref:hypothetical protein n=1 Tax=Albidovulum sp. TaxID=1872424 RepID=UPI001DE4916D|nr:hypothetical protein [Paracoccaceae bacterium]MCC0062561.1 hypothetical protein [Defluviimonas sp.]
MATPRISLLISLAGLAACSGNPPDCAREERKDLATIEALMEESRTNLQRGYTIESTASAASVDVCLGTLGTDVGVSFCTNPNGRKRPVALDTAAEERKLAALEARRAALLSAISAKSAACAPEPKAVGG